MKFYDFNVYNLNFINLKVVKYTDIYECVTNRTFCPFFKNRPSNEQII